MKTGTALRLLAMVMNWTDEVALEECSITLTGGWET